MNTNSDLFLRVWYCVCGIANEDNEHFLMHCPIFQEAQRDPLGSLSDIPGVDLAELDTQSLCHLLLFGNPGLTLITNRLILSRQPKDLAEVRVWAAGAGSSACGVVA